MARTNRVWGIDVGNCSLKALRCRLDDPPTRLIAEAFDYIEYPKILTQPGAEPGELVREALKQFLSRHSVRGDRVAVSVPGQNGLARFVKLPPIEAKKIPEYARYEARQQIPFALQDVVWDYQRMRGGLEEQGFALETEIGLFAMKRNRVFQALQPFREARVRVDLVQLTPVALCNYLVFDQLHDLPPEGANDPQHPPPSVVMLSLGTDATDLVITNGYRVWPRSIPLGGNHFTKALVKELRLTFAKAEHLKRNAAAAQDPKAVFQAMRPAFNDLLSEVRRSIAYFSSIDRNAKLERMIGLGNAMKLPGLRRYLAQSLSIPLEPPQSFVNLVGAEVVDAPLFKENLLSFGVCYGLAVQGVGRGMLKNNLLPSKSVKPWWRRLFEPVFRRRKTGPEVRIPSDHLASPRSRTHETQQAGTGRRKRCKFLFVLGGGFQPGFEVAGLCMRYMQSNPDIDFSYDGTNAGSIEPWSSETGLGVRVGAYLMLWLRQHGMRCNLDQILYQVYYDPSGKGYVVAAYLDDAGTGGTDVGP